MGKKKYFIIAGVIFLALLGVYLTQRQNKLNNQYRTNNVSQKANQGFIITGRAFSPQSSQAITHNEILHEIQPQNPSLQRFIVKSTVDGSTRELLALKENNITFEKIMPQNWSPTNRFIFVYMDYPNRRDVLFLKTDGKFTNGQYYLHSTGLYPNMNVMSAKWINTDILELQTKNIKTNKPQKYLVNFDDDAGIVTPES